MEQRAHVRVREVLGDAVDDVGREVVESNEVSSPPTVPFQALPSRFHYDMYLTIVRIKIVDVTIYASREPRPPPHHVPNDNADRVDR